MEHTNDLLRHDPELSAHLHDLIWAFRDIGDLVPQTLDKLGSGHYFPFVEAETELNNAVLLAQRGFYRHAMVALRSVLELGLLSAYWDRTDRAEVEIQNWLRSIASTPRIAEILNGLRTIPAVEAFEQAVELGGRLQEIYRQLSDFVHTRGYRFSGQHLNRGNVLQFNEAAFRRWADCLRSVVRMVITVHLWRGEKSQTTDLPDLLLRQDCETLQRAAGSKSWRRN